MASDIHFAGSDFMLQPHDVPAALLSDLRDCGGPGDATPAVRYVLENYAVTGDPADCAAYLRGYGAWGDSELSDHASNLERLVWLTGCALAEGEAAYFSTY